MDAILISMGLPAVLVSGLSYLSPLVLPLIGQCVGFFLLTCQLAPAWALAYSVQGLRANKYAAVSVSNWSH